MGGGGSPSKLLYITAVIIVPILTFVGGSYFQNYTSERAIRFQEFSTATTLLLNENVKHERLRESAQKVVDEYAPQTQRTEPSPSANAVYFFAREIVDDVCIFPLSAFTDPPIRDFVADRDDKALAGKDARLLLFEAVEQYRALERHYNSAIDILKKTCGFARRRGTE